MATEDEADSSVGGVGFDVAKALLHEVVVAEVGVRVIGNDREENNYRQIEEVGDLDGEIESGIVVDAHCALHPVDDALGVGPRRAVTANEDARVTGECGEWIREREGGHASLHFLTG